MTRIGAADRRRFLVALGELSQDDPTKSVFLHDLAERAALTSEQAIAVFLWLQDTLHVRGNLTHDARLANVSISWPALQELDRMRKPAWRRWWYDEPFRKALIANLIAAVGGGLVVWLLTRLVP